MSEVQFSTIVLLLTKSLGTVKYLVQTQLVSISFLLRVLRPCASDIQQTLLIDFFLPLPSLVLFPGKWLRPLSLSMLSTGTLGTLLAFGVMLLCYVMLWQ